MRHVDEYRDPAAVRAVVERIHATVTRPWTLMEVCGGQTHSILKFGMDELLPAKVRLVHGPGCPVCVTPLEMIDRAIAIASRPDTTFCSFGDMLRVPGSTKDLFTVKSEGGDVRVVYSPMDAVALAQRLADALSGEEHGAPHESLSPRELQVLRLVASGKTVKQIAAELALSDKTIDTYRARIAEKTGLSSNVELTRYAFQHGLTQ